MISAITGTSGLTTNKFDELKSDVRKDKYAMVADKFMEEIQAHKDVGAKQETSSINDESGKKNSPDYAELGNKLKSMLDDANLFLEFRIDDESKKMVLRIIDDQTKEVVRQFPPELTLKIARIVANSLGSGQLTNAKV